MSQLATAAPVQAVRSALMMRVFLVFVVLAALSAAISMGGRWLGASIAMGGHSDDPTWKEVVIGNDVVVVPANAIRHERARRSGIASRLDLYLRWPEMVGYSDGFRSDFNHVDGSRRIVFLGFEPKAMSRDMSGRFEPIYSALIEESAASAPNGLQIHAFTPASGYANEELVLGRIEGQAPFVARCMTGPAAADSLAPCERDIFVGKDLSLTFRFPRELLAEWRMLDEAVRRFAEGVAKSG